MLQQAKWVSFEADRGSAIESNDFSAAASSISADAIVGEDGPDSEPIPDEPEENPELKVVPPPAPVQPEPAAVQPAPEPEPITESQPAPAPALTPAEDIQSAPVFNTKPMAQSGIPGEINAPIRKRKIFIPGTRGHFRLCACKPACFCSCSASFTACTCSNACSDSTACSADSFSACVQPACSTACGGSSEACG